MCVFVPLSFSPSVSCCRLAPRESGEVSLAAPLHGGDEHLCLWEVPLPVVGESAMRTITIEPRGSSVLLFAVETCAPNSELLPDLHL